MKNIVKTFDCKIEALVVVDKRGQMVPPKDLRDKASIKAGDRVGVIHGGRTINAAFLL